MFSMINNLIDRCFFTLTFIAGVQLPAFIHHYIQQLSGHLNEAKQQLSQFQTLADQHYQGDITLLIKGYKSNGEQVIVETGTLVEQLLERVQLLTLQLEQLSQVDYLTTVFNFIKQVDITIARQTVEHFVLSIPLTSNALITGLVLAVGFLMFKELLNYLVARLLRKNPPLEQY